MAKITKMADKKRKRKKDDENEVKKVDEVEFYKHYETLYGINECKIYLLFVLDLK